MKALLMSGFHFPSTDREERLGKLKFGADWEGPQSKTDLEYLSWFREPSDVWEAPEEYNIPRMPIERWEYSGPFADAGEALAAKERALKRRQHLAVVRELLKLFDKYGPSSNVPAEFEPLKPWEDRAKLADVRRLTNMQSDSVIAKPKIPPTDEDHDLKPSVPKITGKRGPKSIVSSRVESEMVADVMQGGLTRIQLSGLLEKVMVERYGASRDTCRSARIEALKKIKKLRQSSRAAAATRRNSDK
jgi:hypothetical protein